MELIQIIQVVITRTKENKLKLSAHTEKEVVYNVEYDNTVLFWHVLEDLLDELKPA